MRLQRLHWVSHAKNAIPMYRVDKPMMLLPKWVGQGTQAQDWYEQKVYTESKHLYTLCIHYAHKDTFISLAQQMKYERGAN